MIFLNSKIPSGREGRRFEDCGNGVAARRSPSCRGGHDPVPLGSNKIAPQLYLPSISAALAAPQENSNESALDNGRGRSARGLAG